MAQLDLTTQEIITLLEALQSDQSDLRMEIVETDRKEFKDQLKATKLVIEGIIAKLQKSLQEAEMHHQP